MKKPPTLWMVLGIVFILIGIVALLPVLDSLRPTPPSQSVEAQLSQDRNRFMQPKRVVELMNLRPGLTVLDIGAGYGQFTFLLAEAVGDGGKVFATDIDPHTIHFLSEQVRQNSIANVFPVLVQEQGLDSFYEEHTFDVILASEVVPLIPDSETFFTRLASSLKRGSGRLWIVTLRLDPDFEVLEFDDFSVVSDVLRLKEVGKPIVSRLSPEVRKDLAVQKIFPETLRMHLVEDLNSMLDDPTLWPEFEHQPVESVLNSREKRLRDYLHAELNKEGVFASGSHNISDTVRPTLRLLNRLIIQDVLNT